MIKFVAEEGDYVFELQRLIEDYLGFIQKDQLLSKADEKTIFSVGPELLELHNTLYVKLKDALKAPDCEIGAIIEEKVCFIFIFFCLCYFPFVELFILNLTF